MTPPRRRASDAAHENPDPLAAIQEQLDRIELHVAGGLGNDGKPVKGLGEECRELAGRVFQLERAARIAAGIFLAAVTAQVSAWFGAFGGKHL